jgi:parallel beta-helix repeat protein
VAGNTIQGSTKGIFLQYGSNSVVRGNDISGCTDYALWVRSGQNSRIFGNTFRNCGPKSLWMDSAGPGDTVFNNNFLDAPPRILIAGTYVNAYNLAAPTGGNFFAVWPGPDLNNDGFVDSPYVIQAGYQDNLPWTRQDGWLPVTTAALSGTVGNGGWFRSDVTLTLTATDNEGIAATRYSYDGRNWQTYTAPLTLASPGTTTVYYRSTDLVGHVERTRNVQVKIDKTAPAVTFGTPSPAPNAAGWNNTAVSVPFTATDDLSGVAFTVPAASPLVISAEGAPLTASVTAADNAGNTATASVSGIKIDRTPPVVTITSPAEGAFFLINDAAAAAWDAVDALSGIASRSSSALDTSQAGVKTFTATATDYAGNSGSASRAYTVMSAGDAIGWLIARVQSLGLDRGIENSLVAKLQNARASLEKGNKTAAVNQLQAFLNELNAQSGKKEPAPDAGAIGTFTVRLIGCLG